MPSISPQQIVCLVYGRAQNNTLLCALRPSTPPPPKKGHGRHCRRPYPFLSHHTPLPCHMRIVSQRTMYGRTPTTKKARPSLPTAVPPHSPPTPGPNRQKLADGRVRTTKNTAVIANGRAPTLTPYARQKPANGRTPTTKKHGLPLRRPSPPIPPLRQEKPANGPYPPTKKHGRHC